MEGYLDLTKFDYESLLPLKLRNYFYDVLIKKLIIIEKNHKELKLDYVFLFGSCARGEAFYDSDIDILLLTHACTEREIRRLADDLGLDDELSNPKVQITVRKSSRFVNLEEDGCHFNRTIYKELKLLRRYVDEI